jgi:hypothetical protein
MNDLVKHRDFIEQQRHQIDVRLAQIAGALNELSILQEAPAVEVEASGGCHSCGGNCDLKTKDQCANSSEDMVEQVNKDGMPI